MTTSSIFAKTSVTSIWNFYFDVNIYLQQKTKIKNKKITKKANEQPPLKESKRCCQTLTHPHNNLIVLLLRFIEQSIGKSNIDLGYR